MSANDPKPSTPEHMLDVARRAVELARKKGAREASASAYRAREVEVQWRDGKLDKISEATTRGLGLSLYVEGRYSDVETSDLRPEALDRFIEDAVALARALEPDPHRALPDPGLYAGQAAVDLETRDPSVAEVTPAERLRQAKLLEDSARAVKGPTDIRSVTTYVSDASSDAYLVASNGFEGSRSGTTFWLGADVSVQDPDGRRPEESEYAVARWRGGLPDAAAIGRRAAERAYARVGAAKAESAVMTVAIDARAAGRLVGYLMAPLSAQLLQQKRSFLEGKLGVVIGSPLFDVADDPLLPRGLGSRLFDEEGLAARRLPLFEGGVLRAYYVDNYYGRKLGLRPTTARASNLAWKLGARGQAELLAGLADGLLVTGFLGGNSNAVTGDFSLGVQGFRVRGGALAEPIAEMNVAGNHLELWKRLVAVGDDPYPYSPLRPPTLVFEGVQVAGV